MSAGLGSVPAGQTYLDIGQGNRVFDSLYDSDLKVGVGDDVCAPIRSSAVVERAESAPAEIVPGLLATTLAGAAERCEVRNATLPQLSRLGRGESQARDRDRAAAAGEGASSSRSASPESDSTAI